MTVSLELKKDLDNILQHYLAERQSASLLSQFYMWIFFNPQITIQKINIANSLRRLIHNSSEGEYFDALYTMYHQKYRMPDGSTFYGNNGELGIALQICMDKMIRAYVTELMQYANRLETQPNFEKKAKSMKLFIESTHVNSNNQKDVSIFQI